GGITREEAVGATGLSIGGAITIATGLPLSLTVPSVTLITQALLTESGRSFLQEALATLEGHPSTAVTSALDKVAMGIEDAGQRLTNALVEMGLLPRSLALFTQPGTGQQQPFPLPPVPPEPHEETAAERITREQAETATRLRLANRSAFFVEENRVQASVAEPFTPASPEDVAQSRRELRTFPTVARPTADSERKLADLRGELAALEDPTRIVASEVDKIVQGFTGTGLEEAVRKVADQTVRMKIDRQIGDVIRDLRQKTEEAHDPVSALAHETENLHEQLKNLGALDPRFHAEVVSAEDTLRMKQAAEFTTNFAEAIAGLRQELTAAGASEAQLQGLAGSLQASARAAPELARGVEQLADPLAKSRQEMDLLVQKANLLDPALADDVARVR